MMWLLFVVSVVVAVHDVVVMVVVLVLRVWISRLRNVPPYIISQIVCKYGIIVELY